MCIKCSVVVPDQISMGSRNPDQDSRSGFGSSRAKMAQKNWKTLINLILWSAGCSLLRAEGFSCSLDVLYGCLGISKCSIFYLFFVIKTMYPHSLETLDPYKINSDPHLWVGRYLFFLLLHGGHFWFILVSKYLHKLPFWGRYCFKIINLPNCSPTQEGI